MTKNAPSLPRVLLVEDEVMVSMMVQGYLEQAGFHVLAAANLADALKLAEHEEIDVAVLDVNLDDEPSFPVAEALRQRGIAFMFASGYSVEGVPQQYRNERMLQKPFGARALLETLASLRER